MSVIRAFIAIDLTPEIQQHVDQVLVQFKNRLAGVPVRWVPAENIHLTLKFLGEVSLSNLEMLKKILQSETANHSPFEFSVGGVGAFPSPRHPRVVWVGIEAPPDLANLQRSIETAMARLGYAKEDRPFSPHLTLGRVSRNATSRDTHAIGDALEAMKIGFLGAANADFVHLYHSDLKPSGAIYSRIFSTPLKRAQETGG